MKFMLLIISLLGDGWVAKIDVYPDRPACVEAAEALKESGGLRQSPISNNPLTRAICILATNELYNGERR